MADTVLGSEDAALNKIGKTLYLCRISVKQENHKEQDRLVEQRMEC